MWRVLESVEDELPEDDDHFYSDEANKYKLSQQVDINEPRTCETLFLQASVEVGLANDKRCIV